MDNLRGLRVLQYGYTRLAAGKGIAMKFQNVAICDLRSYNTPEAAASVEAVHNAALVILPKSCDEQTRLALAKIKMKNVASTVYADADTELLTFNGNTTLTADHLPDGDSIGVVNGTVTILPLPESKRLSLIVNGAAVCDKRSAGNVNFLAVNGTVKTLDFSNVEFLPDPAVLPAERFTSDTDSCYYGRHVFVPAVPPTARGEVTADLVVAHPSVQKSALTLSADTVLYADIGSDLLFKKDMAEFRLSEGLLDAVSGKLVLMDIAKLYIEKDVTAKMLLQKVCLIADVALLRATKETFDVAQLLAHNVAKIRRR